VTRVLFSSAGKVLLDGATPKVQIIPSGSTADDCVCCGQPCPCECYDPLDPDCNQPRESAVGSPSVTISGVTNTYQVTHLWEQDAGGQLFLGGSVCNCYRQVRIRNYQFTLSGLSGLNGTYPSTTQSGSFTSPVGPCTTPTSPTGYSSSGCGICTANCTQNVWVAEAAVTASIRFWGSETVTTIGSGFCVNVPADSSYDFTNNYSGYAFVNINSGIVGDQGYPGVTRQPSIVVWLWKTGDTNPSIIVTFPYSCGTISDPGYLCFPGAPGGSYFGFPSCGEPHWLGLGQNTTSITSPTSCHPRWHRFIYAPEYSCYTGSDHPTIGNISCAANSHSGTATVIDSGCDTFLADSNQYFDYSYDTSAFSANFSLSL